MPTIDKKIHFVWSGGDVMPENRFETVKTWQKQNPSYEVIVWMDKATTPQDQIDEFTQSAATHHITIKDITENGIDNKFIRHELDKIKPNYGKSSDLIRLAVLAREGGIYLDVDVLPGKEPFPEEGIYAKNGILFSPYSQSMAVIGNDILMASADNVIMKRLEQEAYHSYGRKYSDWLNRQDLIVSSAMAIPNGYSYYEIHDDQTATNFTIDNAGPSFLRRFLFQNSIISPCPSWNDEEFNPGSIGRISDYQLDTEYFLLTQEQIEIIYYRLHNKEDSFNHVNNLSDYEDVMQPPYFAKTRNTGDWLKEKKEKSRENKSYAELLEQVIQSIFFEIENIGCLSVNGYIADLSKYTDKSITAIADDIYQSLTNAILSDATKKRLVENVEAYELLPTMLHHKGEEFFNQFLAGKKAGQYLLHTAYYHYLDSVNSLTQEDKISFLNKIVSIFDSHNVVGGEHFIIRLRSKVDWKLSENHTANLLLFSLKEIKSLSLPVLEKQKFAISIFSAVTNTSSANELMELLEMMLDAKHPLHLHFTFLREEQGKFRAQYGNTRTWNTIISDIKNRIVGRLEASPESLNQHEYDGLKKLFDTWSTDMTRSDFFKASFTGSKITELKNAGKIIIDSSIPSFKVPDKR